MEPPVTLWATKPYCEEGRDFEGQKEPGTGVWGISSLGTLACSACISEGLFWGVLRAQVLAL